jgi:hypothetical protein
MDIPAISTASAYSKPAPANQSEADRVKEDVGAQRRAVYHGQKAAAAADVGQPDGEDHQTDQRDADGRLLWEEQPPAAKRKDQAADRAAKQSKDPSRHSGNFLDLTG